MDIQGSEIISQSVVLRNNYRFDEAIKLIEENITLNRPRDTYECMVRSFLCGQGKGRFRVD